MIRRATSTAELDRREGAWWADYGDLEEKYCWALPDRFQPLARLRYLDRILATVSRHDAIVDFGCGTGWLSLALARRTRTRVIGVDLFASQIERARANAARIGVGNAEFHAIGALDDLPAAGAYLFHGVLHHLAQDEIDAVIDAVAARKPGVADLIVVEPTVYPGAPSSPTQARMFDEAERLFGWRRAAARLTFSRVSPEEARQTARIEGRWAGELPYGPSPKEKPFERDELVRYLGRRFRVLEDRPVQCLALSQRMSSELALAELSMPLLVGRVRGGLLKRIDAIERRLLAEPALPDRSWYMSLIQCVAV